MSMTKIDVIFFRGALEVSRKTYHAELYPAVGEVLDMDSEFWVVRSILHTIKDSPMSGMSLRKITLQVSKVAS